MNFKVGVFADGQMSGEMVNEAKRVLQEIALKYKCRFELSNETADNTSSVKAESKLKANLQNKASDKPGVFLSFGGELEL